MPSSSTRISSLPDAPRGLSANALKWIAIVAMTMDHLSWTLAPGYSTVWWVLLFHLIGRISAPIMWFFISEGYHYTHNIRRYTLRLFLLAFVSHFAYNFCFGIPFLPLASGIFNQTGVVWSLAWGLVLLRINDNNRLPNWLKLIIILAVCVLTFPSDWSCIAAMAILFMGTRRSDFSSQMFWMMFFVVLYAVIYFFFIDRVYGILQLGVCLSIPLLRLYNGTRGKHRFVGRFFYYYYPAHLFVCGLIRILLSR